MASDGSNPATDTPCACGRTIEPDHQYCPTCGRPRPTADGDGDGGLGSGDGPLLLLARDGAPAGTETRVRTGPGWVPRAIGIGLAVVGLVLMWSLFRQPSGEVAPDPADDEESVADGELSVDEEPGDTEDDDEAATDDEPSATEEAEETEEAEDEAREGTSTTARGPTSSDPSGADAGPSATDEPVPPLLGEETGLHLAIGRSTGGSVELLDLDTGVVTEVVGARGQPLGQIENWLVVRSESTGSTVRIDLENPDADPIPITAPSGSFFDLLEISDEALWIVADQDGEVTLQAIDLDGQVVDEVDFPVVTLFAFGPWSLSRPSELLYDPGRGLYRRSGDEFELVAEGQVLAAGERVAVMRQCDENRECDLRWYDIRSSGVIGFPAPPPADGQGFYQLVGGDRWLVYLDWRTNTGELVEVATSRSVRVLNVDNIFGTGPAIVNVSEDGRWLVDVVDGMLVVVDLDSGNEWPTGQRAANTQTLFVDR